eukprot:15404668-Alexandrium_andersonii.AAC.1
MQARMTDPPKAAVPLREAVPHFAGTVGRGHRVARFVHVEECAVRTACGAKQWAQLALRLIAREQGRSQSEGPPMRGAVLEAHQQHSTSAGASSSRARKRIRAWDFRP